MRLRTIYLAFAAVAVGYFVLAAPELVGFTVMLLAVFALWRVAGRSRLGVRR
ncbi:hypothetical protein SAMN04244553_6166 [Nocardia amikacinitolerans]|uniref:Uncharacterized protein n=1 Tax=Nocardia amikacinitolerans TaxID=756689 RepID=A0A285LXG8_9NOCA|nr:hypothetical protein [Nocardia amikacinitolerans]SNY89163.1 hypothetical protein SAMN04244553_6166 [Nocardia amikacinitolerans]